MTHKFFRMIILFALFLVNKVIAQTGSGLDTLTKVNGWRLVSYVSGVTFAKTWFTNVDPYHGRYSQIFEVNRNESDVAPQDYYYAIFKKTLKKRIKKFEFLQFSFRAYSIPKVDGAVEIANMDIAFENDGRKSDFQTIIDRKADNWITYPIWTVNFPLDSIDCVYLKVSGSFKVTVIQIDYLVFLNPWNGFVFDIIDDFEDATITDVGKEVAIPTSYSLSQNYPNPFNPSTTIHYNLSKSAFVTLKVFDVLGREVETLVNEEKSVGEHTVKFNGSHLSSGMYFYQITIGHGQFVQTKKMILMK